MWDVTINVWIISDNLKRHLKDAPCVSALQYWARSGNRDSANISDQRGDERGLKPLYGLSHGSDPGTDATDETDMTDEEDIDVISLASGPSSPVTQKLGSVQVPNGPRRSLRQQPGIGEEDDGDHTEEDVLDMWLKPASNTVSVGPDDWNSVARSHSRPSQPDAMIWNHSEVDRAARTAQPAAIRRQPELEASLACGTLSRLDLSDHPDVFQQLCIRAYMRNFHPIFPFLHASTLQSSSVLRPVIAAVGSISSNSPNILGQGRQLLEAARRAIIAEFDRPVQGSPEAVTTLLQAAVLVQCSILFSEVTMQLKDAYKLHGLVVACAQQFKLFDTSNSSGVRGSVYSTKYTSTWKRWYTSEETIRTMLMLYILDAELSITQGHKPLLDHGPAKVPQALSDTLFLATTAENWLVLYDEDEASQKSCLTAYCKLESIAAAIFEARIDDLLTEQRTLRIEKRLQELYTEYLSDTKFQSNDKMGLILLWHLCFLSLSTTSSVLNRTLSHNLSELDKADQDYILDWSRSTAGQRSMLHALAIKQIVVESPMIQEPPLHFPQAVFVAALCIFCFIKFGSFPIDDLAKSELASISYPELEMAGVGATQLVDGLDLSTLR